MCRKSNTTCVVCNKTMFSKSKNIDTVKCKFCKVIPKILTKCFYCKNETVNKKYCSRKCATKSNNVLFPKRKTKKKCQKCNENAINYRHSFCEIHQKEYLNNKPQYYQNLTLEDYWNKKSLSNLHKSSKNAHIRGLARSWFKDLTKLPCANCGYNKHVELCHIKPISSFDSCSKVKDVNSKTNIIQLCPNCHWEFDNGFLNLVFS